jgi:plasmid stabilization system protein ParE
VLKNFGPHASLAFDELLRDFEKSVCHFPLLYNASEKHPEIRRAVMNPQLIVFYTLRNDAIVVVALQDTRAEKPGE